MKSTPKPSLVEERSFPFECSDSYGVEKEYRELHWHQEMEICYIKHGTGKYLINGVDYDFSKGDIFIINNDDFHLCHDDNNLIMQVIMFNPSFLRSGSTNLLDYEYLRPFLESSENFCHKLEVSNPNSNLLICVLSEIEQEYNLMQKGYELMIKSLLLKFLTLIIRHFSVQNTSDFQELVSKNTTKKIHKIVMYIEENYKESITLNELSKMFNISVPYLCSSFKMLTGISPIDFVIKKRIAEAKRQLTTTEKNILTISEECGFRSLSNFNHTFKTLVGCSASTYRKS